MKRTKCLHGIRVGCLYYAEVLKRGFYELGIRFADAIEEWGPLIAHVSQSETVQFACGKREVPKPAELLNAKVFRPLRRATRGFSASIIKKQVFYV